MSVFDILSAHEAKKRDTSRKAQRALKQRNMCAFDACELVDVFEYDECEALMLRESQERYAIAH